MAALPPREPRWFAWTVSRFASGLVLALALAPSLARAQVIAGDWTPNGIAATSGPGEAISAIPVPDESGGLYVVWAARPVGGSATEVRVRRLYSSATWDPHWPTDGVLLGPNSGPIGAWRHPSGGLVVSVGQRVWRLTGLGALANGWPTEGKLLEPSTEGPFSVGTDLGGRVWALGAKTGGGCTNLPGHPPACWSGVRYHAVRLDQSGNYEPGWEYPGKVVFESGNQSSPQLGPFLKGVPGGVAVAYTDAYFASYGNRTLSVGYLLDDGTAQVAPVEQDLNAFLTIARVAWDVDATGAIFVSDGQSRYTSAVNKHAPQRLWPGIGWRYALGIAYGETRRTIPDDAGGVFVHSYIAPTLYLEKEFVHHLLPDGVADPRWPPAGLELPTGAYTGVGTYTSTRDARGGYFAAWTKSNGPDTDIYALRLLPDGSTPSGWIPAGTPVCNVPNSLQRAPVAAVDASANIFVTWLDARNGPPQVFAQKIGLDSPVPVAIASASAELEGGAVRLRWRVLELAPLVVERSTDGIAWSMLNEPELEPSTGLHELVDEHPVPGEVNRYRLREADMGWTGGEVSILVPALVATARLAVVPNPVTRASRVAFVATTSGEVSFSIHDLQGRQIAASAKSAGAAGEFEHEWDALTRLPRGLYWLRMRAPGGESRTVRFVVAQ